MLNCAALGKNACLVSVLGTLLLGIGGFASLVQADDTSGFDDFNQPPSRRRVDDAPVLGDIPGKPTNVPKVPASAPLPGVGAPQYSFVDEFAAAQALLDQGQASAAITEALKVVKKQRDSTAMGPGLALTFQRASRICAQSKDPSTARSLLEEALKALDNGRAPETTTTYILRQGIYQDLIALALEQRDEGARREFVRRLNTLKPPAPMSDLQKRALAAIANSPGSQSKASKTHASTTSGATRSAFDVPFQSPEAAKLFQEGLKLGEEGKHEQAAASFQQCLRVVESTVGPDHENCARVLGNAAIIFTRLERYAEAEAAIRRVLSIQSKKYGGQSLAASAAQDHLGRVLSRLGKYEEAETLFRSALAIREKQLPLARQEYADTLNNFANLLAERGRLSEAETFYRKSIQSSEGQKSAQLPTSLGNLGLLYADQGRYSEAESVLQRCLEFEEALGADHSAIDLAHFHLGMIYQYTKRASDAEQTWKRCLQLREARWGADHTLVAQCLNALAVLKILQERAPEAEPQLKRALTIFEAKLGPSHASTLNCRQNLGSLYVQQGKHAEAETILREAHIELERTLGADHPHVGWSHSALGKLHARLGRNEDALKAIHQSRLINAGYIQRVLPSLSEGQQQEFLRSQERPLYEQALSLGLLLREDKFAIESSAEWLINGKGMGNRALGQRAQLGREARTPQSAELIKQLLAVREELATRTMTEVAPEKSEAHLKSLQELTNRDGELMRQLQAVTGESVAAPRWLSLAEIRKVIPKRSVLINIGHFSNFNFQGHQIPNNREVIGNRTRAVVALDYKTPLAHREWQAARYAAWIIPANGEGNVEIIDLGSADLIDLSIQELRTGIQAASVKDGALQTLGELEAQKELQPLLGELSEQVWKPLSKYGDAAEEIILNPDGMLWLLPWGALPVGDSGQEQLLLERHRLRLITSSWDLLANPDDSAAPQAPAIFANPRFSQSKAEKQLAIDAVFRGRASADVPAESRAFSKSVLPQVAPLPGTATEAIVIQPNVEKLAGKSTLYTEGYALESIAKKLARPRIAVFATHGFFLPNHDGIGSANEESSSPSKATQDRAVDNPLLRCGLLLAGCNGSEAHLRNDDGILTGLEIVGLDLRGTELVVLSACETGIGKVRNGEGVAGLRQAFQLAGAKSVVSTLWQVPDRDSALIMNDFFANLAEGQSKADALRNAQLKRITSRRDKFDAAHPFYWAAWTVTGN